MKKLVLINPVAQRSGYLLSRFSTFPPLGLAYVAALTPTNWDVEIVDENISPYAFVEADLLGITAFTCNVNRAYSIAQEYRKRGIKVILGGVHASMMPEEGLRFVDSVVVGEVEGVWEKVLNDFEGNRLASIYRGPRINMDQYNLMPRRDLLDPTYLWQTVQTTRGCPFNCQFCSVSRYLGPEYRPRRPEKVLEEIESIPGELITFVDDNLIGRGPENARRAGDLFRGMVERGLNKKWWMQTSSNATEDESLVALAAQAGCLFVFIGFESIFSDTLRHMKKGINLKLGVENYQKVIDTFHRHGIGVMGAFIIGNDGETFDSYQRLADFIYRSGLDMVQISILTPLPGTQLMEQLQQEDRLFYQNFPQDWDKFRFSYVVHQPKGLEPETIYQGDNFIKKKLYDFPNYYLRLLRSCYNLKGGKAFYAVKKLNQALKKSWQGSHYYSR